MILENAKKSLEKYATASEIPEFKTYATNTGNQLIQQPLVEDAKSASSIYLSPLVKQIIQQHQLTEFDIKQIKGSGYDGRITKDDVLHFVQLKEKSTHQSEVQQEVISRSVLNEDIIIEMDRVRKIIAEHMIRSKQTSAHVTSFIEVDVTHLVNWRNSVKEEFQKKHGIKLTYLPVFVQSVVKALQKFPMLNAKVDGENIIIHKAINIGIATALPNDNLIVPVLKHADQLNLLGVAKGINDLVTRARENKLQPSEILGGTFSITNLGTFGTLAGTPIINQPQVAILGIGTIQKVPSVIETPDGDFIGIRHKTILSLSYDHRIVDGMLAGKFLLWIKEDLENFEKEAI